MFPRFKNTPVRWLVSWVVVAVVLVLFLLMEAKERVVDWFSKKGGMDGVLPENP